VQQLIVLVKNGVDRGITMKYILMILMCSLIAIGCQTTDSERIDYELPELSFPDSEQYVINTDELIEPTKPNFIFMMDDGEGGLRTAGVDEAPTHVAMLPEDLNKIDALLSIKMAYQDISTHQGILINIEREKSNALKNMLILERQSRILERHLRFDVEQAYKSERRDHKFDNVINRITWVATIVGVIAICAL